MYANTPQRGSRQLAAAPHNSFNHLPQMVGNQVLQRLIHTDARYDTKMVGIQAKLKVSQPDDAYEREADRVAEEVLRTPAHASSSGISSEREAHRS